MYDGKMTQDELRREFIRNLPCYIFSLFAGGIGGAAAAEIARERREVGGSDPVVRVELQVDPGTREFLNFVARRRSGKGDFYTLSPGLESGPGTGIYDFPISEGSGKPSDDGNNEGPANPPSREIERYPFKMA